MRLPLNPFRLAVFAAACLGLLALPVVVDALTSPRTWVDEPAVDSVATGDLVVTGSARHRRGVASIDLVVRNLDENRYWNGSGWQRSYVEIPIEVDEPGATNTGWSAVVPADAMKRGRFRARAFARSVEGNGDAYGGDSNDFDYVPGLDRSLYDTEITSPADGTTTVAPIHLEGIGRSVQGVAAVRVALRNTDTNRYWDAAIGGWTKEFTLVEAELDAPGADEVGWTVTVPAGASPVGSYTARAWVRTGEGLGDPFGRGRVRFAVSGAVPSPDPGPPPPLPPEPQPEPEPEPRPDPEPGPEPDPDPGDRLVWSDDFDSLDRSRWAPEHSTYGDGNDELQCYRPENVSVADGRLILRAVTETYTCPNGSTRQVTSGMVRSRGVSFEPGQSLEFRVRLNPADPDRQGGLWPAVWSSGWAGGGWPRGGELDFLEVMTAKDPNRSVFSVHYARPDGSHGVTNRGVVGEARFSDDWHIVRFDYGRDGVLVWYLDGVEAFRVDDLDTIQGYPAPFDQTISEIKINLALGGRPGPLDPEAVGSRGATMEVDYIRVTTMEAAPTPQPPDAPPDCGGDRDLLVPCRGVLLGASGDFRADDGTLQPKTEHFTEMERRLGADFDIFHDFLQWDDLTTDRWPSDRTQRLVDDGRILFTNWKSPTGHPRDWARIAAGDHDDEIRAAAAQVARLDQPTFLTFFHEPEDNIANAAGGDPAAVQRYLDDYRAAFRHLHDVFAAEGADNALWVWDVQGWLRGWEDYYTDGLYPGDDVVDWIGWNPYNWHGCENHGSPDTWRTFAEVIAPFYDWLDEGGPGRPATDKPLLLGEWGTEENRGAPNSDQTKAEWIAEAGRIIQDRFPRLRAVIYFDTEGRRADGTVQFCEWAIDSSPAALAAFRDLLNDPDLAARW